MAECNFCPNKEETRVCHCSGQPKESLPEAWCMWRASPNVYLTFCRVCVPRVAQFLMQKLKDTVDRADHASYHVDVGYGDEGSKVGVLVPNSNCPHCLAQTAREVGDGAAYDGAAESPEVERAYDRPGD